VRVSDLTSYIYCPRLCYYRLKFSRELPNEMHAARELYISKRIGMGEEWALEKYKTLYGDENTYVFIEAQRKFKFNPMLDKLKSVDLEVWLESSKLRLRGILDEIVSFKGSRQPLVLSSKAPDNGAWFKDKIKVAAFCMLLGNSGSNGFVYHCFDGELRRVEISRRYKYHVMKLIERVLRLHKGFVPERAEDAKCNRCIYEETCRNEPSTFASRFL